MANTAIRLGYIAVSSGGGGGGGGGFEEYSSLIAFPPTGSSGVIYLATNTNKLYRWNSITYIEISPSEVVSVNTKTGVVVLAKADIGLGNVDNTSDLNKPISTATQTALNAKYDASNPAGYVTAAQAAAAAPVQSVNTQTGDVVLDKSDVGLGNVDNTSDLNKPISTATQTALNNLESSFAYTQVVYVDKNKAGTYTPDGSINKPYKSLEAMYTAITDASASKRYACLIAPGTYTEASTIRMKGWIDLASFATDTVIIGVSGGATLKWSNNIPGRVFIKDIGFTSGLEILNDNPTGTSGMVFDLDNVDAPSLIFRGRGGGRDFIQLRNDTRISGSCTIQSAATTLFDSTNISSFIMNDVGCVAPDSFGSAITASLRSNYIGSVSISATNFDIYTDVWGTIIAGNLTIASNASSYPCYFNYDATSYPLGTVTLTGTNPAQLVRTSKSESVRYVPAVSGNWTAPVPTEVKGALDNLALNKISTSQKGAANGVAPLNASTKIDATYLPSYVDDVEEYANLAAFPGTGESGKIYVALDTNKIYRWSGSAYVEISPSPAPTWGSITGTLSSQTDLQSALDGKANTSHTQALSTITQSGATTGQVPIWNGTTWAPGVPAGTATWGGITGTLALQTDLQSALDGKFDDPTGTTAQYIRGDGSLATFPTSTNQANSLVTTVFNKSGAPIPKFSVVYINGGQGDLPTISLAQANNEANSSKTYGVVYADIPNMQSGQVIVSGALTGLNTDQFNPTAPTGDVNGVALYLSPTIPGGVTTTKPAAPDHMVYVATIVRTHQNEGVVEVRIQNGFELQELHNVQIPNGSAQNNQVLKYDSATSLWKNKYIGLASDIEETSFSIANNQAAPANITGLAFSNAAVRSFSTIVSVSIDATADLFEVFEIKGIQKGSEWDFSVSSTGDNTGISFSITNAGQIQYTSASYAGFVSGVMKFRASTTSV